VIGEWERTAGSNVNDGSRGTPRLRIGISLSTVTELPEWSTGPKGQLVERLVAIREAGIEAAQAHLPDLMRAIQSAGLVATAIARVDKPEDARVVARRSKDWGCDCTTLHVGTGFESDDEAIALLSAIVDASTVERHPLFVETHRATVTQDMKRTLDMVARLPELRFNGDFSHWYTGQEMTYGVLDHKLDRLQPVLQRTRFLHGRISSPGCIQIPVRDGGQQAHIDAFRRFWSQSFAGFLAHAQPGDVMGFYPELLPPSYHYARLIRSASGELTEESDRWAEALALIGIARECWSSAQ
jgi:hypothetical protein